MAEEIKTEQVATTSAKSGKKETKTMTMAELQKKHREERKALQNKILAQNYHKLMTALKTLNPDMKDDEIIERYVADAKAKTSSDK